MTQPLVYVGMVADLVHHGHVSLLHEAARYGRVVVGLLTDEAVMSYKRRPLLCWEERRAILLAMRAVAEVIPQHTLDYRPNLRRLRPDFVVHGDDWRSGIQSWTREGVLEALAEWGGQLIEPPYTAGISSTLLWREVAPSGAHPRDRAASLRPLLGAARERARPLRLIGAQDTLAGVLAAQALEGSSEAPRRFDGLCLSSLAASRGRAETAELGLAATLATTRALLDVCALPLVVACDSGGSTGALVTLVEALCALGASAVVVGETPGTDSGAASSPGQDGTDGLAAMLAAGKAAATPGFQVVARCETQGQELQQAVQRALRCVQAGADGILVQGPAMNRAETLDFVGLWRAEGAPAPLWLTPTTGSTLTEEALGEAGVSVIVYGDHLMRAAGQAIQTAASSILRHGRALELERLLQAGATGRSPGERS